ncbi:PAN-3 domain-containing protein [Caenorhabditis elegans]|uniref:PAN-3 domain-containing protein n=1 Tax=Caenorhabditis elegans TaxID=6239 RepID=Q9N522_CAEEL|nr:PAN-3 domain-containing protein [Caenorhabditis elegans]CCD73005.1 PAN-3 domain-containing protein [Caenorhabditis elegans]|eukprot:NP_497495.1 Uncharacterized protein CELE_Y39A3A.2 [Caenorhabditis elegans]
MLLLFLTFNYPVLINADLKLIEIYRQILGDSNYTEIIDSWNYCMTICYWDVNCLAVHKVGDGCRRFSYGNITIERFEQSSESIVAFKRNETSDQCPFLAFNTTELEWLNNDVIHNLKFSTDDLYYRFELTRSVCPKNSTVFPRTTKNGVLHVCLEVRYFPDGAGKSYDDARELCKEDNGVSLTGPAQNSEREFVKASVLQRKEFIFLDGRALNHNEPLNFEFEDETHDGRENYGFNIGDPNSETVPNYIVVQYQQTGAYAIDIE